MVEVREDDNRIYVKMLNRGDANLEKVYNKNYFFSLGLHVVDEESKDDKDPNKNYDVLDAFTEGSNISFTIEKNKKDNKTMPFMSYLDEITKTPNANPLTNFTSGIDYNILESITNDLCSCVEYIKLNGMQLVEKKKEQIYVINGRFIILTEEVILFDDKNVPNEESILKILSEICGINYARGEDHFKPFIYGTFLYNKLKSLID
jgi:hypothetical protein